MKVLRLGTKAKSSTIGIKTHFPDAQLERPLACPLSLSPSPALLLFCLLVRGASALSYSKREY